jgi:hypothetical protein
MNKLFNYKDFLNEEILIDLDKKSTGGLSILKNDWGKMDATKFNRLKHLLFEYDDKGSPIMGEKIASLLLGADNLNYYSKSYPFVDLIVKRPVDGITKKNEYISIKTSATKHSLSTSITDVNGFKISQLIHFIIQLLPVNIFKDSKIIKFRNAIRTDALVTVYYRFMKKFQNKDIKLYEHLFKNQLYYIFLLKNHIEKLRNPEMLPIDDTNDFYGMMFGIILCDVNNLFGKDYTADFEDAIRNIKPKTKLIIQDCNGINYVDRKHFLPDDIANMQISYCMLYLESDLIGRKKTRRESTEVVLHLQKTRTLSLGVLLDRAIQLWMKLGFHTRTTRDVGKQNIYFRFIHIVELFEPEKASLSNKEIEFDTHLKVIISKNNINKYSERDVEQTDLIVKVIDDIKGLPLDGITDDILKNIEKIIDLTKLKDRSKLNKFIRNFNDFYEPIRHSEKKDKHQTEPEKNEEIETKAYRNPRQDLYKMKKYKNMIK